MFEIKLIKHQDVTEQDIKQVVDLKSMQWNFSLDKQIQWIKNNIKNSDFHMFLLLNGKGVAYLNLIDIDLIVNGISRKGLGIGNVCAIEKGKGHGFELMKEANKVISNLNQTGLLFCKEPLLKFYHSLGWEELAPKSYKVKGDNLKVMVFNIKYDNNFFIEYDGIIF
ncbi:GNAT family N-acetyltransferase [Acinetobacter piscicola]|uniref:GNAT family N-acetyltransferase n=1 Tax=Acinetobacter piscicola TaxID=2006115 RepID=UPI000B7D3327|nr:GNAT family N-acetyltransferase [Acinetobacter piscicola]